MVGPWPILTRKSAGAVLLFLVARTTAQPLWDNPLWLPTRGAGPPKAQSVPRYRRHSPGGGRGGGGHTGAGGRPPRRPGPPPAAPAPPRGAPRAPSAPARPAAAPPSPGTPPPAAPQGSPARPPRPAAWRGGRPGGPAWPGARRSIEMEGEGSQGLWRTSGERGRGRSPGNGHTGDQGEVW